MSLLQIWSAFCFYVSILEMLQCNVRVKSSIVQGEFKCKSLPTDADKRAHRTGIALERLKDRTLITLVLIPYHFLSILRHSNCPKNFRPSLNSSNQPWVFNFLFMDESRSRENGCWAKKSSKTKSNLKLANLWLNSQ